MATITAADVNARIEAYDVALAAGDIATAKVELLRAAGLIVGLPDVTGQDGAQVRYGREDIDKLIEQLDDLQSAAAVEATNKAPLKLFGVRPGRPGSRLNDSGLLS